jgi:hypothetical protein
VGDCCPHFRARDVAAINRTCTKLKKITVGEDWTIRDVEMLLAEAQKQSGLLEKLRLTGWNENVFVMFQQLRSRAM